jgi:hypothetical protein
MMDDLNKVTVTHIAWCSVNKYIIVYYFAFKV